jgi:molybdopterin/thiamine biosynthesis adenylyltransferase
MPLNLTHHPWNQAVLAGLDSISGRGPANLDERRLSKPVRCVGAVGFEPTVYRFLQLQCLIIHAAVSSNNYLLDHWSLSPCLSRVSYPHLAGLRPPTIYGENWFAT